MKISTKEIVVVSRKRKADCIIPCNPPGTIVSYSCVLYAGMAGIPACPARSIPIPACPFLRVPGREGGREGEREGEGKGKGRKEREGRGKGGREGRKEGRERGGREKKGREGFLQEFLHISDGIPDTGGKCRRRWRKKGNQIALMDLITIPIG